MADDVATLLKQLKLGRRTFSAIGMGGKGRAAMAIRHPNRAAAGDLRTTQMRLKNRFFDHRSRIF